MAERQFDLANNPYDAIVVLGRSIGKEVRGVRKPDGQFQKPEWRPSAYFGRMKVVNGRPIPLPHSGIYDNKIDPNLKGVMVAGGNACVLAASYLTAEQLSTLEVVILAAGKPQYLESEAPDLSEGIVMKKKFLNKLGQQGVPPPDLLILHQNKSTMDDMVRSIEEVKARGLQRVAYITVGVHINRSREFLNRRVPAELREGLDIDFLAAEAILGRVDHRYKSMFAKARKTPAYRRTSFFENRGRRALVAGNY